MGSKTRNRSAFSLFRTYRSIIFFGVGIVIGAMLTLLVQQASANNLNSKNNSNTFLAGTVYSSEGGVISRAKVSVLLANQTFTDTEGRYVLAFPNGTFNTVIHYNAKGYQERRINTSIVKGATVYQDVTLQKIY